MAFVHGFSTEKPLPGRRDDRDLGPQQPGPLRNTAILIVTLGSPNDGSPPTMSR
jgi:hypothetical protein